MRCPYIIGKMVLAMKNIFLFLAMFVACSFSAFAGGKFPPNGKKCEIADKVIYVDKRPIYNIDWREMLWTFENQPEIITGSVSENGLDSTVWWSVYNERITMDNLERINKSPVVGFSLKQLETYAIFRATVAMYTYNNNSKSTHYKDAKLEYLLLSSEQYAELLKQKWFAKSFVDGYAEITSDGKFVKNGKILDSVDDVKVTFRMYAVIGNN